MNTLSLRRDPFRLALSSGPGCGPSSPNPSGAATARPQGPASWPSCAPAAAHGVQLGFLVAFLLFNYVLVATARARAAVARGLLGSPEDPLREAKEVLRRPGPLRTFMPN